VLPVAAHRWVLAATPGNEEKLHHRDFYLPRQPHASCGQQRTWSTCATKIRHSVVHCVTKIRCSLVLISARMQAEPSAPHPFTNPPHPTWRWRRGGEGADVGGKEEEEGVGAAVLCEGRRRGSCRCYSSQRRAPIPPLCCPASRVCPRNNSSRSCPGHRCGSHAYAPPSVPLRCTSFTS
jgi:hypothetical protein